VRPIRVRFEAAIGVVEIKMSSVWCYWLIVVLCRYLLLLLYRYVYFFIHSQTSIHPSIHPFFYSFFSAHDCIENNHGMGTSIDRHSSIVDYYKMGNAIPGIRIDGMNVLPSAKACGSRTASRQGTQAWNDDLPYHGHSMSDPGTNREEIAFTRSNHSRSLNSSRKCLGCPLPTRS
jgi:hypothetical protein